MKISLKNGRTVEDKGLDLTILYCMPCRLAGTANLWSRGKMFTECQLLDHYTEKNHVASVENPRRHQANDKFWGNVTDRAVKDAE